jgi:hypothetical protein
MSEPHTITVEQLEQCLATEAWHEIAMSSGDGSHKKLEVSSGPNVRLRVTDHSVVTYEGPSRLVAVHHYNEAR